MGTRYQPVARRICIKCLKSVISKNDSNYNLKICKSCYKYEDRPSMREDCASHPARRANKVRTAYKHTFLNEHDEIKLRMKHLKLASLSKNKISLTKRQLELIGLDKEDTEKHGWAGRIPGLFLPKNVIINMIMLNPVNQRRSEESKIKYIMWLKKKLR